jgi:serine/threonine protein kinase/tetratricopeptide (TPR) repeat protein
MLATSTRLGPYEIIAPLGAGGMGEVYRARDTRLGREVAVKVLPEPFANNPERRARFEREAKAVAALSHPNILAIHDYGTEGGITYAVMELLEGETLRDRLGKGPLPWREAVEIGAAIAEGLAAAHAKGIVHRDLKPENLFLTNDGRVKILDFGLARVEPITNAQNETSPYIPAPTNPGVVMGTVGYMSPEQVRSQPADARSDIFSFGCVLYEMLTGRRAFQHETAAETMTAILHEEPPEPKKSGPQVPAELGRIIRQCLAKSPNQRLQSARDLALALRATASDPALHLASVTRRTFPLVAGIIAALVLIGIIVAATFFLSRGTHQAEAGKPAEASQAIEAVAVLPFENVGGDPEAEHLSDGIAESIIKSLYEVRSLKVRPFSSVSRYKGRGKDLDLQEVGRQLKVQAVVTGKLTQRKDGLWLSVELVDVRDPHGIWSEQYDPRRTPIQRMPAEVAKQLSLQLGLQLTANEQKRLTKQYTDDPEAYQLYLKGRYFMEKRTEESFKKGIEYFKQAIKKDREYALAYAGLADCYSGLAVYGLVPPKEVMPDAKEAALKALEMDETLAEAHTALAVVSQRFDWNWSEAERSFKRAIELNPGYARAHLLYAFFLGDRRRFDEARAESGRAQELDPVSPMAGATVGWALYFARRYDQAIDQFKKTLEADPQFWVAHDYLARVYFQKGMYGEAIEEFQKAKTLSPGTPVIVAELGYTHAVSGKKREAQMALDELKELSRRGRYVPMFVFALLYSGLGDKDRAFEWLEKAYEERSPVFEYLEVEPFYDGLRSDPRVLELLRRLGLADKSAERDSGNHSVAVLPFENLGGDPKTEFLSDGVADQIINSLSQVRRKDLKVRPFTSVSRYRKQKPDVPTMARELNVQMIVTGTLRQQGDDLSISVALVDAPQDSHLWGQRYQGKLGGILDLQDQISRDIAANLRLRLSGEEDQRLTRRQTENSEAYLLYREGVYHMNKFTESGLATAVEYYQRALKKDANYALAYVGLGRCYILLGAHYRGPRATFSEARKMMTKAIEIDPTGSAGKVGLGTIYMFHDWDWAAAERVLKQPGGDLDPGLPTRTMYGFYLAAMGRPADALAVIREGEDVDPLAAPRRNELAMAYNWTRQYGQAIAEAKRALELDLNFPLAFAELAVAYAGNGMNNEAHAMLQKAVESGQKHPRVQGMLGYVFAILGKKAQAQMVLEELKAHSKGRFGFSLPIARIHAALGEKDQAFEWLRKSCDERDPFAIWIKVDPTLDNLRADPQFAQALRDMGLPP